jgi:hypothetical protein
MSITNQLRTLFAPGSSRIDGAGARSGGLPQGLVDAQVAQRKQHQNADGTPRLTRISDGREVDLGHTTVAQLPAGSFSAMLKQLQSRPDAGRAMIVGDNVDLAVLRFAYGSHKSMEAWLTSKPKDNRVVLNMAISPSCHAGATPEQKSKNYELFGKTNVYNVEVEYADGSKERMKFDVRSNDVKPGDKPGYDSPVYATLSPDIVIDLERAGGKAVKVRGWADGSAGVGGYVERRETILHLG